VAPTCTEFEWIDRYVTRLTELGPSLPLNLANAVARAELDDFGWLEPELAAEFYVVRQANRDPAKFAPRP
jgi:hypothetical protein